MWQSMTPPLARRWDGVGPCVVSFVAWQERPGIDCHRVLVVELDLDEDCINNRPRLAGVGTLVFIGGGICIICEHLVSVEVYLSFFGSQDPV